MCKAAGASEIACLSLLTQAHWDGTGLSAVVQARRASPSSWSPATRPASKPFLSPGGQALTEARDRQGARRLRPLHQPARHQGPRRQQVRRDAEEPQWGLNSGPSNRTFHKTNWKTDPADIDHLETCIVDLNTVLKPHLNIVDATEIITSNGPMGPGDLAKPGKIIAGIDRVAIDAYRAKEILGLNPAEIVCIRKAFERKLGEIDLSRMRIETARV
ncbi:MAG: DUF362 domain-containing protein [Chromatiales bacterium]|nr:DUF362 domain-containing protein [Chromatiales bacterium]